MIMCKMLIFQGVANQKKARGNHFPCEVVFWLVGWLFFFVVFWLLRGQKFVVEPLKVPMNGPLWLGRWFDRWMQPAVLLRGNSLQSRPWERGEGSQEAQDWRPIFSHLKNLGMQLVYKINLVVSATKGFWLKDDFNRIFWNLEDDGKEIFDYCNYYLTFSYFFNYSSIDRSRCRGRAQAVDSAFVSRLQIFDVLGGLDGSQQFLVAKTTAMEKNHCPPGSFT